MKGKWIGFAAACAVLAAWAATVGADPPPLTLWTTQIGSSGADYAHGIAVDAGGNSYITGYTWGDLGGPNQGNTDAFIVKYNSAGTVQWVRQFGTIRGDLATGIAVDSSGNSYITGFTYGDLGGTNQGLEDAFIVKHDSAGTVQWARQFGSSRDDEARGIALDGSGNSYITGWTWGDLGGPNQGGPDAFIVKYDSGGTVQWTQQIGTGERDFATGIAVDGSGNSYIAGSTDEDAFIIKCDSGGTEQWRRQIGTSEYDAAHGIAVDGSGNSYITGPTEGDLGGPNQGMRDAFVAKYDNAGTVQWATQVGTNQMDCAEGIAVDGSGNIYITGRTYGDLGGPHQGGFGDAFIVKCDSGGTVQWMRQIGTSSTDRAHGIAVDGGGKSYITGWTGGDLGGANQGNYDAFIVAIGTTPATAGDANYDDCVDGLDYIVWSSNYKTGTTWGHGDFTGEGYVDGLDYVMWSNNYKQGCPAAVPEPCSAVLLLLGTCALLRRRSAQVIRRRCPARRA